MPVPYRKVRTYDQAERDAFELTREILSDASFLGVNETNVLAHALGWPDLGLIGLERAGRPRWRNPYRNRFEAGSIHPDRSAWETLVRADLAEQTSPTTFRATERGIRAARCRLRAALDLDR